MSADQSTAAGQRNSRTVTKTLALRNIRTVVVLLLLLSLFGQNFRFVLGGLSRTEVWGQRYWGMSCSQDSDCNYNGCERSDGNSRCTSGSCYGAPCTLRSSGGCMSCGWMGEGLPDGCPVYGNCPERPCPSGTFSSNTVGEYVIAYFCQANGVGRGGGTMSDGVTPTGCTCTKCPVGKYSNTAGATVCTDCGAGNWSNVGATGCTPKLE